MSQTIAQSRVLMELRHPNFPACPYLPCTAHTLWEHFEIDSSGINSFLVNHISDMPVHCRGPRQ